MVNKSKKSTPETYQKPVPKAPKSSNPFSLLENQSPPLDQTTTPPPIATYPAPETAHPTPEIQSKKQKLNSSVLILDYVAIVCH